MQRCKICNMVVEFVNKSFPCIKKRRSSSSSSSDLESIYNDLGDQDTLKLDDRFSFSDDSLYNMHRDARVILVTEAVVSTDLPPQHKHRCTGKFRSFHKRRKRAPLHASSAAPAEVDTQYMGQGQCMLRLSLKWRFNAFALENFTGGRALPVLCLHLFHAYGLISYFNLDTVKLWKLFSTMEAGYHNTNPYHNSVHAADVTQAMHCFLQQAKIMRHLEPLEIMACLIGAMGHDMEHPGVSQHFLIATDNYLAQFYENKSVLENHHWRAANSCLIESGVIESPEHCKELQLQIKSLIMATDITRQDEFLDRFRTYLDTNSLDMANKEHRHLVLQIALKCADISNPCRPWDISKMWSLRVCEEFFRQGDCERRMKIPITSLCDRFIVTIPAIQAGFFKFVAKPLMREWHRYLQNDLSTLMIKNLTYNQKQWENMLALELSKGIKINVTDSDLLDDYLDSCSDKDVSESSELLLPIRKTSLKKNKPSGLKQKLRRLSAPLHALQDSLFKSKGNDRASTSPAAHGATPLGSLQSIHSLLHEYGLVKHMDAEEKLSAQKLLPKTSIASLTTPAQASRLRTVFKNGGSWRLVRQQSFPPLDSSRISSRFSRSLCASADDAIYAQRDKDVLQTEKIKRKTKIETKEEKVDAISNKIRESTEIRRVQKKDLNLPLEKSTQGLRRDSLPVGTQFRDNLSQFKLNATDEMRRRKSMPTVTVPYALKEKKIREVTAAIPELLRRTLSVKDNWSRRRGSAPAPEASSEFRGLASLNALRHSVNGGCPKLCSIITCQQWLATATNNVQERTFQHDTPRRGSLPAEVISGISSH
ncbi:uncharacterized protein LOC112042884 isoform X2 [Bicyclus anynana]|uniref:Phosphodiesterase n=1 Tax=Bicyclus anynana TaxID=110368 RepID=A0ABM3M691_BICAN|nr:uncharacterized protein LOC112042884 isoform X2 [Bicyclus anynana]